jgi:hypothetical protein
LTLAMATIGCHYTKTEEFDSMVVPFHEFLCSVLHSELDTYREPATELLYLQAFLLSQVGLTYYGPTEMRDKAMLYQGSMIRRAENLGLFSITPGHFYAVDSAESSHAPPVPDARTRWHVWVKQETARRLAYSIWVSHSHVSSIASLTLVDDGYYGFLSFQHPISLARTASTRRSTP